MADDVTIGNKALHHQVADFIKIPLIWLKISSFKNHDCVQVFFQVLISASSSLSDCFSLSLSPPWLVVILILIVMVDGLQAV